MLLFDRESKKGVKKEIRVLTAVNVVSDSFGYQSCLNRFKHVYVGHLLVLPSAVFLDPHLFELVKRLEPGALHVDLLEPAKRSFEYIREF